MNRIARLYWTGRALGWDNLPRRAWQVLKLRLKLLERSLPAGELPPEQLRDQFAPSYDDAACVEAWKKRAAAFGLDGNGRAALAARLRETVSDEQWESRVTREVRELQAGRILFFSRHWATVGAPPDFLLDPLHDVRWPRDRHWSKYSQFTRDRADIKCVWEASRFSWAYALAREYVRNGAEHCAALFWEWLEAWDRQNPYGTSVPWACGQESSFRCFAWVFAACTFSDSAHTTPQRLQRLTQLIWYTGRHVSGNIVYARSQKNNHALSEAVCLWMIGLLFEELKAAPQWREQGQTVLRSEVRRQVYSDGSFVQHSVNYHRVLLDDLCWAASVSRAAGVSPPDWLCAPMGRAADWLRDIIEPGTGIAPNYGANDGAWILPLSCCDYRDYRPAVQAACALLGRPAAYPDGPWNESAAWLARGHRSDTQSPATRSVERAIDLAGDNRKRISSISKPEGGYYIFRGPRSQGMLRCHSYKDRPHQNDMLHFDLSYGGQPLLRDGGSYSYFTKEPWQSWFYSTAAHNTVEVDGQDQMVKGPRFLWLRWTKSQVTEWQRTADGRVDYLRGQHFGYTRLPGNPVHDRAILRVDDAYVVIDEIRGGFQARGAPGTGHQFALRWRLRPGEWQKIATDDGFEWGVSVDGQEYRVRAIGPTNAACELVSGQESPQPEGWESLYYAEKTPAPTIVLKAGATLPVLFFTFIQPRDSALTLESMDPRGGVVRVRGGPEGLAAFLKDRRENRLVHLGQGTGPLAVARGR